MSGRRLGLAQRRKTVGLSQERLAEIIGVDRSTVVRWERADTDPQPWHRPRLADALDLSIDELAELLADIDHALPGVDAHPDDAPTHPGDTDHAAVADLREQIAQLDAQYERVPSTLLLAQAGQLYGRIRYLRQHATDGRVRGELVAAEVASATLMGQLIWDASQCRDHATATSYFDEAIAAARETRNVVAEACATLRKSHVALYGANDPAAALALGRVSLVGCGSGVWLIGRG